MAIEKYLNDSDYVFDPIPSYVGLWFFDKENLIRNSKKENGKNLFQEYYIRNVYNPLKSYFKRLDFLKVNIGFVSEANSNLIGRHLCSNKVDFFLALTKYLNSNLDRYEITDEEFDNKIKSLADTITKNNDVLNSAYEKAMEEKEKKLETLIKDEFNSVYFDAAMKDFEEYKLYTRSDITFTEYINNTYELTKDLKLGLRTLGDFFDQDLNHHELYDCFDPDTFYLLFATIIYEFLIMIENENGTLDNSYSYLKIYFDTARKVSMENKRYDPTILYTWDNGKKEKVSRWNLQIKFEELIKRHPEVKEIKLPKFQSEEQYKDIVLIEKLKSIYDTEARLNWEFLPEGEKIKQGKTEKDEVEKKERVKKDNTELINDINTRIKILENSGYIGTPIKGLNSFSGYYAFVYSNGVVILEKFWNNEDTLSPARYNATYVMNIDNFIEMSKVSKMDLIEYMKELPESGVKRIFHTSINNWQRNLFQEINGTYRLEDAINFISSLRTEELTNEQ